MAERRRLPDRRDSTTLRVAAGKMSMLVTVGLYEDGTPGEVFTSDVKAGTEFDAMARDAAVLLSLSMQYGVPLDVIGHAVTRDRSGAPSSVMGALIDVLLKERVQQ